MATLASIEQLVELNIRILAFAIATEDPPERV